MQVVPTKDAIACIACKGAQVGEGYSGLVAIAQPDQTNVICCELSHTVRTQANMRECVNDLIYSAGATKL